MICPKIEGVFVLCRFSFICLNLVGDGFLYPLSAGNPRKSRSGTPSSDDQAVAAGTPVMSRQQLRFFFPSDPFWYFTILYKIKHNKTYDHYQPFSDWTVRHSDIVRHSPCTYVLAFQSLKQGTETESLVIFWLQCAKHCQQFIYNMSYI